LIPAGDGTGDPDAVVASRNAYTPYGVTRGDDNLATDRGWLGQVEDQSSGLTYLNARYYDPAIARFISPDPLMDPTDPRTLDPYRYADNNPVLFTDPSGLAPSCYGLKPDTKEYTNCYGYSNDTYNYATGKTKAKKNEENAKSGKAPVNKTKPKKNSASSGKKSSGKPHTAHPKGVRTGETSCSMNLARCLGLPTGAAHDSIAATKDAAKIFRFGVNVVNPVNAIPAIWAYVQGERTGDCEWESSQMFYVCYGATAGYNKNGSGTSWGAVYVTEKTKQEVVDLKAEGRDVLGHEGVHSTQIAVVTTVGVAIVMGIDSVIMYMGEDASGPPPDYGCNVIERTAGYNDGGYGQRCGS